MGTLTPRGEKQINLLDSTTDGLVGTQADPAVTALSNGNFVVVYEDPVNGNTANVDLLAHFFNSDGNAIAPPATTNLSNGVVGLDQSADVTIHPAIAATASGGFVVAYSDASHLAPSSPGIIDVREYNPVTGTMSQPFSVWSLAQAGVNAKYLDNASIGTFADGNILVAFDQVENTDSEVLDAILNPTATAFVVNTNSVTSYPTFHGESRIATSGNTAALVFASDPGNGPSGGVDIVLTHINSTGTALAAPTTVFGTNSADHWSHPDVAALSDGRFVVVAQDDTIGTISVAVVDPATHTVLSTTVPGFASNPHVTALPGGGFVVSVEVGGQVLEIPGSAGAGTGPTLSPGTFVESYAAADENALAANANGTVFFAWQDTGASNPTSTDADTRIQGQAFRDLSTDHAPVVTATSANVTATPVQFFAASSLFSVTDADSDTITAYQFWDDTTDPASGHWVVGGVAQPTRQAINVTPTQLATATFQSGSGSDDLFVRASDGITWSNWAEFHVNGPTDTGPVVSVANLTATHGESFDGVDLFTYTSAFGLATQYDFWNSGDGGGHFVLNGVALDPGQHIINANQIGGLSYQSGSGADTLDIKANDGRVWGAWSSEFTVTAPVDAGPTIFVTDQIVVHGQSVAATDLGLYSDPFNSPGVLFDYWDNGNGGGHFVLNGTALPASHDNIVNLAQLAQLTYQPGSGADTLWIRANDGTVWGGWSKAFTVTADNGPTLSVANLNAMHGQSFPGSSLFSNYTDPFNLPATQYDFYDTGDGGGHFVLGGTALGANQDNIIPAAQLAQLSYQSGSGTDKLWVRANDGTAWGNFFAFTVTAPIDLGPTLTVGNLTSLPGVSIPAASLISHYSDPFGSAPTQLDFWDTGTGGGHFALNGNALGANQDNIINVAELGQTTYVPGFGTDTIWVRANDGTAWGSFARGSVSV